MQEIWSQYKNPYHTGTPDYIKYNNTLKYFMFVLYVKDQHFAESTSPTKVYLNAGHYDFCGLKEEL